MKIEDAKRGMRLKRTCEGCPGKGGVALNNTGPCVNATDVEGTVDWTEKATRFSFGMVPTIVIKEHVNGCLACPASQFTPCEPIPAPAQDWSLEALRAVKTKEEAQKWLGAKVGALSSEWRLTGWRANTIVNQNWLGYCCGWDGHKGDSARCDVGSPGEGHHNWWLTADEISAIISPPAQQSDSKDQPAPETFPGGFKVGDRVQWGDSEAVVVTWEDVGKDWHQRIVDEHRTGRVPVRMTGKTNAIGSTRAPLPEELEHLKEEELKNGGDFVLYTTSQPLYFGKDSGPLFVSRANSQNCAPPEHIPDDACGDDRGLDCIRRDQKTLAYDNGRQTVCLMCGALIPYGDWRHELSVECARKRDRRHLPELPKCRHLGDEEE